MENTYVYLDEGYLSKISEHFGYGKKKKYCIKQFANTLAKSQGLWCKKAYFYTASPYQHPANPTQDELGRVKRYKDFINKISNIPDLEIRQGRCQKDDKGGYHQKGVDTHLTMDLFSLNGNIDNIKTIIILACDTDFVPILNEIRTKFDIKVILAYFNDFVRNSQFSMSNHMLTACDDKFLIKEEHFKNSNRENVHVK